MTDNRVTLLRTVQTMVGLSIVWASIAASLLSVAAFDNSRFDNVSSSHDVSSLDIDEECS